MTLVSNNFSFELFSFDPEWKEDDMEELLDGVDNPLDFQNILTSNASKVNLQPYYAKDEIYWDSKDVGIICGYTPQIMKDIVRKVRLIEMALGDGINCYATDLKGRISADSTRFISLLKSFITLFIIFPRQNSNLRVRLKS